MRRLLHILCLTGCFCKALGASEPPDWKPLADSQTRREWWAKSESEVRRAAEAGNASAMWILAWKLQQRKQSDEFKSWLKKAEDAGLPQALTGRAEVNRQTDLKSALADFEKASATGYPEAKTDLADILVAGDVDSQGFFVKADTTRAVELLQQALDDGHIRACAPLAELYTSGIGEPRHAGERPVALLQRACKAGDFNGVGALSTRLRLGWGIEKDLLEAAGWMARARHFNRGGSDLEHETADEESFSLLCSKYESALMEDSQPALVELAGWHEKGFHGKANIPRAIALYTLAQRAGSTPASAKKKELELKLDGAGREAVKVELEWMDRVHR